MLFRLGADTRPNDYGERNMTRQPETTASDIARALGLHGGKHHGRQGHPLPLNTRHEPVHHLLRSNNWGMTRTAVLLVTGIPEEANELSRTEGTYLDTLFGRADEQTAVAQVYVGGKVGDILGVAQRLPAHLRYAWGLLGNTDKVHVATFSAGALALRALAEMPEAERSRVHSLTLASPLLGKDCARSPSLRWLARGLSLPMMAQYLDAIAPLVEGLLAQERPVRVAFGQRDPLIASDPGAEAFRGRFPQASVEVKPRAHAPAAEELWM